MIWSISWRNIWRSKTRSLVIISAIALGIFAGVFIIAFLYGWVNQRIDNVIKTEVSHIQIHQREYMRTNDVHRFIPSAQKVRDEILEEKEVQGVSARLISNAMIASAESKSGIQLIGVTPEEEQKVTDLHTKIVAGKYFEGIKRNPVVIGQKLAKKLNVKLRSKIVLTISELDGTLTKAAFRIAGIYKTSNTANDELKVYALAKDMKKVIKAEGEITHEIAILLNKNNIENKVVQQLQNKFPQLEVAPWTTLIPEIKMINENMNVMTYVFVGIILLALGFGIINTMLMVILERIKELGMIMAIGMNKLKIFLMIVVETVYLAIVGGSIGIVLAVILITITHKTGIDLSVWTEGLQATGFDTIIYPEIQLMEVLKVALLVVITGIIASIYPARKAIKLNPSEALRVD
ncbi:ABC transporter permease [Aquimarina hainanensis]|uniref:ABC transporter permease n=1 Tax=Aquimarina hainanensis TaxID=1578017 RepID=A0ABW5N8M1_9FLAO|nr:FtsX-like permease family protein [Aquimarina sp. TRL1]QKX05485.1 ABC transporter permease [Aquimarina sp. TRL1]